jgi:hypothetical protein
MSRMLGCHAHGSAWACWQERKSWPLKAVAMAPKFMRIAVDAQNSPPGFCAPTAAVEIRGCRSARSASAAVRQPGEGAQLATASVGKDSARRMVRIAKERIVWEQTIRYVYICLDSVFGHWSPQCVRKLPFSALNYCAAHTINPSTIATSVVAMSRVRRVKCQRIHAAAKRKPANAARSQ